MKHSQVKLLFKLSLWAYSVRYKMYHYPDFFKIPSQTSSSSHKYTWLEKTELYCVGIRICQPYFKKACCVPEVKGTIFPVSLIFIFEILIVVVPGAFIKIYFIYNHWFSCCLVALVNNITASLFLNFRLDFVVVGEFSRQYVFGPLWGLCGHKAL